MKCQWQLLMEILPPWMRNDVDRLGKKELQELRLRLNSPPELVMGTERKWLMKEINKADLDYCINIASRYSPWASATASKGYITAQGGHRIGLCGNAIIDHEQMKGIQSITSLCIRVARDFPGIARTIDRNGSVLIIGKPGSGKTTLLRDFIRQISDHSEESVAVVDERGEIFPYVQNLPCFSIGKRTDVMTGCTKIQGIEVLLRTMSPGTIAIDEITAEQDCNALFHAGWCGVRLIATAHAGSKEELYSREVYRPVVNSGLFDTLVVLNADKTWRLERMMK